MEVKIETMLIHLIVPTVTFMLLGLLLVGSIILTPNNSLFSFTIYGFTAVFFYNLIRHFGLRTFIYVGLLFTILTLILFKPTTDFLVSLRNFSWFLLIGIIAFAISLFEKKKWYHGSKMWIVTSWFFGFVFVYIVMTILNVYVYKFYQINERLDFSFYIKQSIKLGSVLGIGIGFGNLITQSFKKTNTKK